MNLIGNKAERVVILNYAQDHLNVAQFENLQKELSVFVKHPNLRIVLDLSRVRHMDCYAAGHLVAIAQTMKERHSLLMLRGLKSFSVRLLADTLKLSQTVDIER